MLRLRAPDLTTLWHGAAKKQLLATRDELDWVASIDTINYDNVLACDSMAFDFDAGRDLWLTKSRFTILQRDYLDAYSLSQFLDRCESIGLGEAKRGVITQMFAVQHKSSPRKYRWGNCMMAWTFRGGNRDQPPVLAMHSRVAYIAYIGGLDLALCHVLAREIGWRTGHRPEDFQFRWHVDSLQFHGFKSLPFLYRSDYIGLVQDSEGYPSANHPTLNLVRKWWVKVVADYEAGVPLDAEKYGPLRRIKRRYSEYIEERFLDPVPIDSLTFDPLRRGR